MDKCNYQKKTPEERQAEALERMQAGVAKIQDSDSFKEFLKLASRFHDYSWGNWLMIFCQRPDATRVAGYRAWQELGRQVRKGERGIKISAPIVKKVEEDGVERRRVVGFRSASVFDVSQTDGEPLPTVEVPILDGDEGADLYAKLAALANGEFRLVDDQPIERNAAGYWDPNAKEIHVDSTLSQKQRVKTLAHELAHALADHGKNGESAAEAEVIAEGAAYLVCDRFGIDTSERSFPYVAAFAKDYEKFTKALARIKDVSKAILDAAGL